MVVVGVKDANSAPLAHGGLPLGEGEPPLLGRDALHQLLLPPLDVRRLCALAALWPPEERDARSTSPPCGCSDGPTGLSHHYCWSGLSGLVGTAGFGFGDISTRGKQLPYFFFYFPHL